MGFHFARKGGGLGCHTAMRTLSNSSELSEEKRGQKIEIEIEIKVLPNKTYI